MAGIKQAAHVIQSSTDVCPLCGSHDVEAYANDEYMGHYFLSCACFSCGCSYDLAYKYAETIITRPADAGETE